MKTLEQYTLHSKQDVTNILIDNATKQKSLHSSQTFKRGELIAIFSAASTLAEPTYLTVQIDIDKHITLEPSYLQYVNHSCNPNVFFNTTTFQFLALKNIEVDEELTFFYPSTEWDMAQSFQCNCGNENCLHSIQGAKYISADVLKNYQLTDFINKMLEHSK
jgi:hypothetical protein